MYVNICICNFTYVNETICIQIHIYICLYMCFRLYIYGHIISYSSSYVYVYIFVDTYSRNQSFPVASMGSRLFQRCQRQWHRKGIIEAIAGSPSSVPTMSVGRALGFFSYYWIWPVIEVVYSGCCYTGIMIYLYMYTYNYSFFCYITGIMLRILIIIGYGQP